MNTMKSSREELLEQWLKYCFTVCDDGPSYQWGKDYSNKIIDLLEGKDVDPPEITEDDLEDYEDIKRKLKYNH